MPKGFDADALVAAARAARENAYAPYSRYAVGAALLTRGGEVFTGCNVENISYGLSCCAERTALFAAVSAGRREFTAIAVAGAPLDGSAPPLDAAPCGACRQVLYEFCGGDLAVLMAGARGGFISCPLALLLPHAFGGERPRGG